MVILACKLSSFILHHLQKLCHIYNVPLANYSLYKVEKFLNKQTIIIFTESSVNFPWVAPIPQSLDE